MRKLKTEEKEISNLIKTRDTETIETFKMMTACIYVYDKLNNTNHLKNIKKIYLENKKETVATISNSLFTDPRSLTRYRKKYLICYKICNSVLNRFKEIFSFFNSLL